MMRKLIGLSAVLLIPVVISAAFAGDAAATKKIDLTTDANRVSYAIGVNIGMNFKQQGVEITPEVFLAGILDAVGDAELRMTEEEMMETIMKWQTDMQAKHEVKMQEVAEENKKATEAFLEENAKKDGVVTTKSGLQYKVIEAGEGKSPAAADSVTIHYRGTLLDGTEFDSSLGGEPVTFPVGGVIQGFSEALKLMKVGDKFEVYIPPHIGYGDEGPGGPGALMIFQIELIDVKPGVQIEDFQLPE